MTNPRLIVVTGALEPGIGKAITTRLLADGYKVLGSYEPSITPDTVDLDHSSNLELVEVDHSDRASLNNLVAARRYQDSSMGSSTSRWRTRTTSTFPSGTRV
jgi:NAD(P)-dependent dehydrogenase (short-subunit alcohol dehydrogenase family)